MTTTFTQVYLTHFPKIDMLKRISCKLRQFYLIVKLNFLKYVREWWRSSCSFFLNLLKLFVRYFQKWFYVFVFLSNVMRFFMWPESQCKIYCVTYHLFTYHLFRIQILIFFLLIPATKEWCNSLMAQMFL